MNRLVIAEKPSVGKEIAAVLGAHRREDGCFIGNGYIVSWCFGHLAELTAADTYDEKYVKWRCEDLPRALRKMHLKKEQPQKIETKCGDLLKINRRGTILRNSFVPDDFYAPFFPRASHSKRSRSTSKSASEVEYLAQLKAVASCLGYSPDSIEEALRQGYTAEDIEEWLYCGQL